MFKLHVQGLSLCVFDKASNRLRICCLNSGSSGNKNFIPIHLQTLIAKKSDVESATVPALRSMFGRVTAMDRPPMRFDDATHTAWDFGNRHVAIASRDGDTGLPRKYKPDLKATVPPNPTKPDFSPLHWVLSVEKYIPEAKLAPHVLEIGRMTSAIADVTGGECFGGDPETTPEDSKFIWKLREKLERAVTDTMIVKFQKAPTIKFLTPDGGDAGEVAFKNDAEAWLINEATDRDVENERKARSGEKGRHLRAFWDAFDSVPTGRDPHALKLPKRGKKWRIEKKASPVLGRGIPKVETVFCIILTVG